MGQRSTKSQRSGSSSFENSVEVAAEDEEILFHPRKRRPSDVSMQTVLQEPLVSDAFRDFMHEKLSENLVSLWVDLYSYERISYESTAKQVRAQALFSKYFADHAPLGSVCNDFLDHETLTSLCSQLMVLPGSDIVQQSDACALGAAFKLTYAKLITYLKFEFMPQFLVSDHFGRLEGNEESLWDELDASAGPDAEVVLKHPWLLSYFSEFIYSVILLDDDSAADNPAVAATMATAAAFGNSTSSCPSRLRKQRLPTSIPRTSGQKNVVDEFTGTLRSARDLVELYFEVEDYSCWAADRAHQFERLRRILSRFGNSSSGSKTNTLPTVTDRRAIEPPIAYLDHHLAQFEMKISRYHDLVYRKKDAAFLEPVRQEVLRRLNTHIIPLFRENFLYNLAMDGASPGTERVRKAERSFAKIRQLADFAEKRKLANQFTYTYTLESALSLPWGAYYLKRFARKRLQEENILFVLEIDAFSRLAAHKKQDKSSEDIAYIRRRIKRICELYIADNAQLQVNISHTMRSEVLNRALETDTHAPDTFDDAREEVLRMLRLNMWPAFQHDNMHENFIKKCAHNMHRRGADGKDLGPLHLPASSDVDLDLDFEEDRSLDSSLGTCQTSSTKSSRDCSMSSGHISNCESSGKSIATCLHDNDAPNDCSIALANPHMHIADNLVALRDDIPLSNETTGVDLDEQITQQMNNSHDQDNKHECESRLDCVCTNEANCQETQAYNISSQELSAPICNNENNTGIEYNVGAELTRSSSSQSMKNSQTASHVNLCDVELKAGIQSTNTATKGA